ncbi:MAG: histidine kinase [Rhodobacteraceae bacterium CG17_big_fil_post_rev_8_21_14_2_50_63_15]|nr:Hpt domain-containing protein [Roseovarius sp.]PIV78360.1 MAG: histidine kinase [Rhodobacteraceae bacterium CG17_big_fil_post_rev_8_21_14_2_50_63_15]
MIEWNRVKDLRNEIGADAIGEVVELFFEEVEAEITKLRDLGDRSDLEAQLHFLKGSALNLGFADFSDLCHRGEIAAAKGQAHSVDLTGVFTCYEASRAAFLAGLEQVIAT